MPAFTLLLQPGAVPAEKSSRIQSFIYSHYVTRINIAQSVSDSNCLISFLCMCERAGQQKNSKSVIYHHLFN